MTCCFFKKIKAKQYVGLCNTLEVPFQQISNIREPIDQMTPNSIPEIFGDLQDSAGWSCGMNAIWFYYQNIKVSKSHKTLAPLPGISRELQDFRNFHFKTKLILNLGIFQMPPGTKCTPWHVMSTLCFRFPFTAIVLLGTNGHLVHFGTKNTIWWSSKFSLMM